MIKEDDSWKPDEHHFAVICQNCGAVGEVDFDVPMGENDFTLLFGRTEDPDMDYEYNLCWECYYELFPEEREEVEERDE